MSEGVIREKRLLNLRAICLFLVLTPILYYIYDQLQDGWDKLEHYRWSLNLGYLLLSILTAFFYFLFTSWIWYRLLSYLGSDLGFWKSFRILQLAQLGKYLPGRIWAVGGQLYLGEREGVSRPILLWAMGLHWFFNLLSGAIIFLPFLYVLTSLWVAASVTVMLMFLLSLGFLPRHILRCLSGWADLSDPEKLPSGLLRLSPSQSATIFFAFVFTWALFGFAFWSLINALTEIPLRAYYEVLASFCGAWVLGAVSFFTPAGLGVREGALVFLLGQFLLPSMAVIISIAARLWITVVELACAAIAWFIQ